jgi:hypothetical protein
VKNDMGRVEGTFNETPVAPVVDWGTEPRPGLYLRQVFGAPLGDEPPNHDWQVQTHLELAISDGTDRFDDLGMIETAEQAVRVKNTRFMSKADIVEVALPHQEELDAAARYVLALGVRLGRQIGLTSAWHIQARSRGTYQSRWPNEPVSLTLNNEYDAQQAYEVPPSHIVAATARLAIARSLQYRAVKGQTAE